MIADQRFQELHVTDSLVWQAGDVIQRNIQYVSLFSRQKLTPGLILLCVFGRFCGDVWSFAVCSSEGIYIYALVTHDLLFMMFLRFFMLHDVFYDL